MMSKAFQPWAVGAAIAMLASAGLAQAQTPSAVTACYVPSSGQVRLVGANASCHPSETRIAWNVMGAVGPTGATGPMGPVGPMGLTGPMGPAGPAGAAGAMGPMGPAGAPGATGQVGPAGPSGVLSFFDATRYHQVYAPAEKIGVEGAKSYWRAEAVCPVGEVGISGSNSSPTNAIAVGYSKFRTVTSSMYVNGITHRFSQHSIYEVDEITDQFPIQPAGNVLLGALIWCLKPT